MTGAHVCYVIPMSTSPIERELTVHTYAVTRFYGPTNYRGARIRVTTPGNKWRVIAYDYAARCAHESAVRAVFGDDATVEKDFVPVNGGGYGYRITLPESF